MPVYLVTAPTEPPTEKLVEAANTASARNHVARHIVTAKVAKQADLFRVAKAGGDIETAGAEPAAAEPPVTGGDNGGGQPGEPPADGADGTAADNDDAQPGKGRKAK
jgi:hypothetical protein